MSKVVFFKELDKLDEAISNFNIQSFSGKKIPLKLHMGEIKNKYFPKPDFVKVVVDCLKSADVDPFLFDTTVGYQAKRHTKDGYYEVAKLHGFTEENVGCGVKIDDSGKNISVKGRDYEVADTLINATHIFALNHVKGHIATGMGGAIKNFGMGGVTKECKMDMHVGSKPEFKVDNCTYCGACAEVCPFGAIKVEGKSWERNKKSCFGCGVCVDACKNGGITFRDADFQYVLACAAKACVQGKKVIYLNELKRISKGCDCDPAAGPIICPDIGYLVSDDPVAIDKASLDIIHEIKPDIFEKENNISPFKQINFGEEIGLGSSKYNIVNL